MESSVTTSGTTAAGVVEHCTLASRRMAPGGQAGPCAGQFFLRRSHPSTCQHHCHDCNGPTRSCPMKAKRRRRGGGVESTALCGGTELEKRRKQKASQIFRFPLATLLGVAALHNFNKTPQKIPRSASYWKRKNAQII